jgi:hypothetical protein
VSLHNFFVVIQIIILVSDSKFQLFVDNPFSKHSFVLVQIACELGTDKK